MINGSQRKIILINGGESSLFESAYFVLRKDAERSGAAHTDMIREANRIIEKNLPGGAARMRRREKLRVRLKNAAFFAAGGVVGGGIFSLFAFLISFS